MGTFEAAEKAAKSKKDKQVVSKPAITTKAVIVTTKRQRRLQMQKHSEKNKWLVQHPKIQSMERREKIYVKDAGLNETKAEKRQTPIDPKLDLMSPEVKFGRMLAGTDQRKRHAAVKKLKAYLKARCDIGEVGSSSNSNDSGISELDLLKLWKALWYTLYMADKKPVQDELSKHVCKLLWCVVGTEEEDECAGRAYLEMVEAEEEEDGDDDDGVTLEEIENTLEEEKKSESDGDDDNDEDFEGSDNEMVDNDDDEEDEHEMNDTEIPHCRGAHLVSLFVRTFFRTIHREWHTMDKYRVDKFYTLIRTMMHEIYEYMALRGWNYGIVLLLNDAIFDEILKQPPNGLRYHLIDLCLEELAKVNAKAKVPLTEATFLDVLEPFFGLCQTGSRSHDDTVQTRVMDRIFDNFLENYCVVSDRALRDTDMDENSENEDESCAFIFDQVHVKTVAEFSFALGSDPETSDKYRKSLYDMHKKYMRRLKQIGKDVKLESDDDDDDMCQFLTEENNEVIRDDSAGESRKNDDCGDDAEEEQPPKATEVEKGKKESKKKKKKKKRKSEEMETTNHVVTPEDKTTEVDKKTKKKKHKVVSASISTKERQEKQKPSNEDKKDVEEVVITLREQKEAKKKEKKAKKDKLHLEQQEKDKKQNANDELNTDNEHGSRRVSFGKKNRAKSHKASMKALRTTEPPSTKETTPVKGILPKNYKYSGKIKTTKGGRKKASSYF